jgi:transposase
VVVVLTPGTVMPKAGTVHSIAEGVEGLRDRHRAGRACTLDEGQQAALKALVLQGPKLERDGCVAWRLRDLRDLVERRFGVRYSETGMLRLLRSLDLSWQKARPVHPEADRQAQERFKKVSQPCFGTWQPVTRRRSGSSCGSPTRPESGRSAA